MEVASYSLSNASPNTHLKRLAWLKCQRYFVERTIQDAKSELGWDELEAQKYLAWRHHLALTILALWFAAQTKID
jgi:SRSO17 transposase